MPAPSYVHGAHDTPLIGATIGAHLALIAARHPGNDALVVPHQNVRWTYAEFDERVTRLAAGLVRLGLAPGDRVGIWSPNCAEWVLTQFATARAGLIMVNINPAYRRAGTRIRARQSRLHRADPGAQFQVQRLPCDAGRRRA